jgi:hypothetical protein
MIFSSISNALKAIVTKPLLLIAVLVSILFGKVLAQLTVVAWMPVSDVFTLWQNNSESPIIALILSNPIEMIIILLAAIISFTVSTIVLEFLARIMKNESVIESINNSVLGWKKAFGVSVTICISVVILWLIGMFFVELGAINEILSLVLLLALFVFVVFAFVKTIFVFPSLVGEKKAKHAFQKSWGFLNTYSSFGKAFLFLIILGIIIMLFDFFVLSIVTVLLQSGFTDELLIEYIIPVIEDMFVTSFVGLAIAGYFYSK